ncbi:MAG: hypothetical protein ACFCGT_01705 [Sandaracinaceae bacterium]
MERHSEEAPRQRLLEPAATWPLKQRLAFGVLALVPVVLLVASLIAAVVASLSESVELAVPAMLVYVHVVTQLIVLYIFGYLLMTNNSLDGVRKGLWAVYFVVLAPAALLTYWFVYVWCAQEARGAAVRTIPIVTTVSSS